MGAVLSHPIAFSPKILPVHPWVAKQKEATPGSTLLRITPRCITCYFSFFSCQCEQIQDGFFRCLECAGFPRSDTNPCCWGHTHKYRPFQRTRSDFTFCKTYCNDCWGSEVSD
ncbi:hypothetical protein ANO14919_132090 [Xylariales sp. No.14919]|nr:hypothetical protein ANO14919_132090 [Xylariales sp. No.14919]